MIKKISLLQFYKLPRMDITIENILLIGSLLLFISILAGKTSYRFGVPTLLLFLTVGMVAGSEGLGGIYFDNPKIAQFIGIVALNFILFSGGLDTRWKSIQPILWQGISLSTLGVLITALCIGLFAWKITDFTLEEGFLLGAIISSTDAAAVFSILRSKNLALRSNLRPTLELESGSNDPMAYFLTVAFLGLVMNPEDTVWSIIPIFFIQILLGAISGIAFARLSKLIINRIKLGFEGLYPVLVISLLFIIFSTTNAIGGNGFLAVYLCGVSLGNQNLIHKNTIIRMFDGLAWLMQIILFLTLGLLVFPSQIIPVIGIGMAISAFLIFVARPLAVFISLSFFRMKIKRRLYISWVGLRGAVPIVFATYPLLAGIEKANLIFNIVFFVSLTSVLIQGTSLAAVAHWFRVSLPSSEKKLSPVDKILLDESKSHLQEIEIPKNSMAVGKKIVDLKIPAGSIIAMITRNNNFITPKGNTVLQENDILLILTEDRSNFMQIKEYLQE